MKKTLLALVAMLTLLAGCADDPISRRYPCRFLFYTQWHPTSMVVTAMTAYNEFVRVSIGVQGGGGAYTVNVSDRQGRSETNKLTNELENRYYTTGIYLGAGGSSGAIIMGQTNFNGRVAWDALCPNCTMDYITKYQLRWTDDATRVRCASCGRTYSLETGNILDGAEGESLWRYIVSYAPGVSVQVGN